MTIHKKKANGKALVGLTYRLLEDGVHGGMGRWRLDRHSVRQDILFLSAAGAPVCMSEPCCPMCTSEQKWLGVFCTVVPAW